MRWHEEYSAHFRKLNENDIAIWDEILSREFSHLEEDEIISAVKILADKKRHGELKFADIDHLTSAIIKGRWEKKQAREGFIPGEKCSLCSSGWLAYYEDSKTREIGKNDNGSFEMTVPCLCSAGENVIRNNYEEHKKEPIRKLSQRVIDWIRSIGDDSPFCDQVFARTSNV